MKLPYQLIVKDIEDKGVAGRSNMWKIILDYKYEHHEGVFQHEYEHLKQWYVLLLIGFAISLAVGLFINPIAGAVLGFLSFWLRRALYNFSSTYRLYAEVEAFKKQIALRPETLWYYAKILSERYRLDITVTEAVQRLAGDK